MAIGTITKAEGCSGPLGLFVDRISFLGDGAYPAGGTVGFLALAQAKIGASRNIIAVIPQDCGGYMPAYDHANDKLKVYEGDYSPAAVGPFVENVTADLSAVTFNLVILSY